MARYRVNPKMFAKGVKYAKSFGGRFDPSTKTWDIPTHRNGVYNDALNAPQLYGLIPVTDEAFRARLEKHGDGIDDPRYWERS